MPRQEDVIRRVLAHHAEQTRQAAERRSPAPPPLTGPRHWTCCSARAVPEGDPGLEMVCGSHDVRLGAHGLGALATAAPWAVVAVGILGLLLEQSAYRSVRERSRFL
jgi:hypothetical protein